MVEYLGEKGIVMSFDLNNYLKGLKRKSKNDIIPGTGSISEETCPLCDRQLHLLSPCCASKYWTLECKPCGYKRILEDA